MSWQILKLGKLLGEYPDSWTEGAARTALHAFRKQYGSGLKLRRNPSYTVKVGNNYETVDSFAKARERARLLSKLHGYIGFVYQGQRLLWSYNARTREATGKNPGKSSRFDRCVEDVSARGEVDDPAAVCAASLRKTGWRPRRNPSSHLRRLMRRVPKYLWDEITRASDRMYYAALEDGFDKKRAEDAAEQAGLRKARELAKKSNPASSAAALSESFHGRPEESESVIDEAVHVHSHLSDLGGMEEIRLAKGRGKIRFGHDVRLASNEDGSQLFLIGGDQSVDLGAYPELDATKECVVLGRVKSVTYNTAKFHLGKSDRKPGPYVHQMGEESGDQPELMYDTINERLSFVGGHYQVRQEGIVD